MLTLLDIPILWQPWRAERAYESVEQERGYPKFLERDCRVPWTWGKNRPALGTRTGTTGASYSRDGAQPGFCVSWRVECLAGQSTQGGIVEGALPPLRNAPAFATACRC